MISENDNKVRDEAGKMANTASLRQRIFSAGSWSFGGYFLGQCLRFVSNLIMTRLLMPEAFGLMAMAMTVLVGLHMFSDIGLKQSVVQSPSGEESEYLNSAWTLQVLRGMWITLWTVVCAVGIAIAAALGLTPKHSVYADPMLPWLIASLSVTAFISGFQSTKLYEASRTLSLADVTKIEILAQAVGLSFMIALAILYSSVWSMVGGAIISTTISTVLSHCFLRGSNNNWRWDRATFKEIMNFGKWIFLSSILGFFVNNCDRLLLAWLLEPALFGFYVVAFLIVNAVETVLTKIIGDVVFPAISEIARKRPSEMKRQYYRLQFVVAEFAYICAGLLVTSGDLLIKLLYDSRYRDAGWMLQLLAITLLIIPFRSVTQFLMAIGKPQLLSSTIAVRLVATVLCTLLGFHFLGVHGALIGIVASHFFILPLLVYFGLKYQLLDLPKEVILLAGLPVGAGIGASISFLAGSILSGH
jgi:O-antigen/teichoic acid export membrane protein